MSSKKLGDVLNWCLSAELNTLGAITHGDDSIDSIFAVGSKAETTLALVPGLREESAEFYSLLGEGREIGLFTSDFDTASASVSVFGGLSPRSKWIVSGGELLEDSSRRFGDPDAASEDEYFFHDLDIEPWNDLYQFIGSSPDDAQMVISKLTPNHNISVHQRPSVV